MNHEDRVIRVEDVDDLHIPPTAATPDYKQLVIADLLRIRLTDVANHHFRFCGIDAVICNVFYVPFDPTKLHVILLS